MDSRTALTANTDLHFGPGTIYTIKREVGRGSSCIVYDAFYQTNAGDEKTIRVKECYPYDLSLKRDAGGKLICPDAAVTGFAAAKEQMYEDFRLCNRLFYDGSASDNIINTINIYEANNTVYIVSAWARENILPVYHPDSLRDRVSIVRQTAAAVRSIHQAGYLYLDIKPENISVIDGASSRVQLFDFDSLIPVSSLKAGEDYRLSYTKGFAALELRRGQFSKLGFHTDVYGIGALLFYLIFGRTPEAPDCVKGAEYDFSKMTCTTEYPDRLYALLGKFFRKTLAGFSPDRWPGMDIVVHELEKIEKLADPVYPYIISSACNSPVFFIGREKETDALASWYRNDTQQNLFVTGMGGIGKSTLVQSFLASHRDEWDSILFLYYNTALRRTFSDDAMLRIKGTERFPEEKETDYFERKLRKLREIIVRDRVMLVIDNFEGLHDPDLDRILALDCRKIFITRHPMGSLNLPVLKLDAIGDPDDLLRLFIHYLDREINDEETDAIRGIIRALAGHTLAVELFARQISNSFITLSGAADMLESHGLLHAADDRVDYLRDNRITYEHPKTIITRLFETDSLSDDQVSALKALTLFPAPGISVSEFMRLSGISRGKVISQLVNYGWITSEHNRIFLHPLILEVIRDFPGTEPALSDAGCVLQTLYREITAESHREEIDLRLITGTDTASDGPRYTADPYEVITDHRRLDHSVSAARGVVDALARDVHLTGTPAAQKLRQAMIVNLPIHEDEAILSYGIKLLNEPEHLTPLEILEVIEPVEKALLARQDYEAAEKLMENAEQYAVDERTKAEYCGLMGNISDYRDAPGDREKMLTWLDAGISHARLAPPPVRKHLLAEYLLGKLNAFTRSGLGDDERIGELELDIAIDGDSVGTYRLTSKIGAIRTIADGDI